MRVERTLGAEQADAAAPRRGAVAVLVPALAVAALIALVAALSDGLPGRVGGSAAGLSARSLIADAAAVVLALAVAAACFVLYEQWAARERLERDGRAGRGGRRRPALPRPSLDPASLIFPLVAFAAVALVLAIAALIGGSHGRGGGIAQGGGEGVSAHRTVGAGAAASDNLPANAVVFAIVASLLLIAGIWLLARERRRRGGLIPPAPSSDGLAAAVEESLGDLGSEPDPRRAVIKAYGRMERALSASGIPRDRAETPLEYLRRALAAVNASRSSISRLTDLFEQARFSRHVIDATMKQEAIEALTALRSELDAAGGPA